MSGKGIIDVVRDRLVETLTEIQANSLREFPTVITDELVPFDDLPGFDSVNGVEAAVIFSEKVGVEIEEIAFVAPSDGRRMTIKEIVNSVVEKHGPQIIVAQGASAGATTDQSSSSEKAVV